MKMSIIVNLLEGMEEVKKGKNEKEDWDDEVEYEIDNFKVRVREEGDRQLVYIEHKELGNESRFKFEGKVDWSVILREMKKLEV